MKINGGPNQAGLDHMAERALGVRKSNVPAQPPGLAEPASATVSITATESVSTGNNVSETGENLPPETIPAQSNEKPDHLTGLERAIERLELNASRNPDAKGLQHALEMLVRNQERHTFETEA
jgi:hypothetical protein